MDDFGGRVLIPTLLALSSSLVWAISASAAEIHCEPRGRCEGTASDDEIFGTSHEDDIRGNSGQDVIRGRGAADLLDAGPVEDSTGAEFRDQLFGGRGKDELRGGFGDTLSGGPDNDSLIGRHGTYLLAGGPGDDRIQGGGRTNYYWFAGSDWGKDYILDIPYLQEGPGAANALWLTNVTVPVEVDLDSDHRRREVEAIDGHSTIDWGDHSISKVLSGPRDDSILGNADPNMIFAQGSDMIRSREGNDIIINDWPGGSLTIYAGRGNDDVRTRDSGPDTVDCGPGDEDEVTFDSEDTLANCEILHPEN